MYRSMTQLSRAGTYPTGVLHFYCLPSVFVITDGLFFPLAQ